MNTTDIVCGAGREIELPPRFTAYGRASPFGQQLAALQNQPAALRRFLDESSDEITCAYKAACKALPQSDSPVYGPASAKYALKKAFARELGIRFACLKLLDPPKNCSTATSLAHGVAETGEERAKRGVKARSGKLTGQPRALSLSASSRSVVSPCIFSRFSRSRPRTGCRMFHPGINVRVYTGTRFGSNYMSADRSTPVQVGLWTSLT